MSRIDPEMGGIFKDDDGPERVESDGIYVPPPTRESPVPALVQEALKGAMSLSRPLKPWEPEKLNPMHIQMIMDRAMGMKPGEIAQKFDMDPSRVSVILNHPFSERILGAILSTLSDRVTDPVERMRGYAHEMIDTKLALVRDKGTSKTLRNQIATDILDRAGYGPKRQLEITTPKAPQIPVEHVGRLADVLAESRKSSGQDYTRFLRGISKNEGEEGQEKPPVDENSGKDSRQTDGASPVSPLPEERKTA